MSKQFKDSYRYSMQKPSSQGCSEVETSEDIETEYYKQRASQFKKEDPMYSGWGSKFPQYLRYSILLEEIKKDILFRDLKINSEQYTILDIGCGTGVFATLLPEAWSYFGIDRREELGGIDFDTVSLEELAEKPFDYTVVSGSFAFMEVPEVEEKVEKMLNFCSKGAVFNLLDAKSDYMGDDPVVHVQRKRFFSYIFNKYQVEKGYRVILRNDYFQDEDFTIGIFKK